MLAPSFLSSLTGKSWQGPSRLHLSWLPEGEQIQASQSELAVSAPAGGEKASIDYTWEYQGEAQKGHMDIIRNGDSVEVSWTDTWHQSEGTMLLVGAFSDDSLSCLGSYGDDSLSCLGSYGDEETGQWGWRIEVAPEGDNLSLKMTNIEPDGTEDWAVEAIYS